MGPFLIRMPQSRHHRRRGRDDTTRARTDLTALAHSCRRILRFVWGRDGGDSMKKQAVIVAFVMTISTAAVAGERATSAALGAVSGAVVLGPVGAVAGAFIGYTAGPAIASSWGVRGRSAPPHRSQRTAKQETRTTVSQNDPRSSQANAQMIASQRPAAPKAAAPSAPPVQPLE